VAIRLRHVEGEVAMKKPKNVLLVSVAAAGFLFFAGATVIGSSPGQSAPSHQGPFPTVWSGVYSKAEAQRGREVYKQLCSRCHGTDLKGGLTAPALVGDRFFDRWHDLRLGDVVAYIQAAMPREHQFYVSADSARAIVGLMLEESGVPAGQEDISTDASVQHAILITRPRRAR
jgi:quinoprotein glucose dehydrogenase